MLGKQQYELIHANHSTRDAINSTLEWLSQTSFYRKMLAYAATWGQNIHQRELGIHRFRVLTVTTSAKRVETLVAACSELRRGQGLFLFADQSILAGDVLAHTWQTGRPGEMSGLLD